MLAPCRSKTRPMNIIDHARRYIVCGWAPIPIPLREKGPRITGWQQLRLTGADLRMYFNSQCNIGIILGQASGGLVDIDLDCNEAIHFASKFLPVTSAKFGRPSNKNSHWLYRVQGIAPSLTFRDHIDGGTLL